MKCPFISRVLPQGRFQIGVFESGSGPLDDLLEEYRQGVKANSDDEATARENGHTAKGN